MMDKRIMNSKGQGHRQSEVNILNSMELSMIDFNNDQESILTNDFNLTKANVFNR